MTARNHMEQIGATHAMIKVFFSRATPAEAASALFPTRVMEDSYQDATEVNTFLELISKQKVSKLHRTLQSNVTKARNSELQKPDAILKFLFRCRKNHIFYEKNNIQAQAENQVQGIPVLNNGSPSSPFLRRSASRDPIHKIKEEPTSPVPFQQLNGHTNSVRSRSKVRSRSMLNGPGLPLPIKSSPSIQSSPYSNQSYNSTEKTSASNPLYFNIHQGTPLKPGVRTKEETRSITSNKSYRLTEPPPYPGRPLWSRTGTTPSIPPDTFFRELRGALQGVSGTYFINDGRGNLVISKTCALNESTITAVQDLLQLGNTYLNVRKQSLRFLDESITKGVLSRAVQEILDEYVLEVGDISPKMFLNSGLETTIARTLPWHIRLDAVSRCFGLIHESNLSVQAEVYLLWEAFRGTESESIMIRIMEATLGVFCNTLRKWVNHGDLVNDAWIIQRISDGEGYKVAYSPPFMSGISLKNVLKIGVSQSLVKGEDLEKLEHFRNLVDAHVVPNNLALSEGRSKIQSLFQIMAEWTGRKVVNQLIEEGHLMEYFTAARKFLFLEDSTFSWMLFKCVRNITNRDLGLTRDQALTAFVTATQQSKASKLFPFRVSIDTLVSPTSTPVGSARSQFMQSIHPILRVEGISEKVFKNTQSGYETIFHILWAVQTAIYTIEEVSVRLRQISRLITRRTEASGLHLVLSNICTHFLRILLSIRQYMLLSINTMWFRFQTRLTDANDADSVAEQHEMYIFEIKTALFCGQETENISDYISKIVQMASTLAKKSIKFEEELSEKDAMTSESIFEFKQQEKSVIFSQLKTELLGNRKTLQAIIKQLHIELNAIKSRVPLVSIILNTQ